MGLPRSIAYMVAFSLWVSGGLRSLQKMGGGMVIACEVGRLSCRWAIRRGTAIQGWTVYSTPRHRPSPTPSATVCYRPGDTTFIRPPTPGRRPPPTSSPPLHTTASLASIGVEYTVHPVSPHHHMSPIYMITFPPLIRSPSHRPFPAIVVRRRLSTG